MRQGSTLCLKESTQQIKLIESGRAHTQVREPASRWLETHNSIESSRNSDTATNVGAYRNGHAPGRNESAITARAPATRSFIIKEIFSAPPNIILCMNRQGCLGNIAAHQRNGATFQNRHDRRRISGPPLIEHGASHSRKHTLHFKQLLHRNRNPVQVR